MVSGGLGLIVADKQLAAGAGGFGAADAVGQLQPRDAVGIEQGRDVWVVIDGEHHFTLHAAHGFGQPLVFFPAELLRVADRLPIRRVGIKEGVRPVVAFQAALPRLILNVHATQTLLGGCQLGAHVGSVECFAGGGGAEVLVFGFTAECGVLQIEKTCGPLNIGLCGRRGLLELAKGGAAGKREIELAQELIKMMLYNAVEVNQLAVNVV